MWTWNSDPFGTDAANPNPAGACIIDYNLRVPDTRGPYSSSRASWALGSFKKRLATM